MKKQMLAAVALICIIGCSNARHVENNSTAVVPPATTKTTEYNVFANFVLTSEGVNYYYYLRYDVTYSYDSLTCQLTAQRINNGINAYTTATISKGYPPQTARYNTLAGQYAGHNPSGLEYINCAVIIGWQYCDSLGRLMATCLYKYATDAVATLKPYNKGYTKV